MSSEQSRFLGVTEEIGSRGEIEVFHLDTKEDSDGALVHTIDDVDEVWTRERRPLGAGGFGVAWLEKSTTGKVRVVKEVKKIVNTNAMTEYWLRELSAMALLHRNTKHFPRFYGWFHDKDYVYIAMEHVNQGDLRECVTCPLPEPQSQSIVKQVAQALRILHKKGITHRDLKPANILVRQGPTPSWRVVVTDFGISKRVRDLSTSLHSSFGGDFMAPEILGWAAGDADQYTNAVDMWSLGCLAYWLLKMKTPVPTSSMVSYCRSPWAKGAASVDTTGINDPGKDFILSLISPDPSRRMNAEDACGHVWLTSMSLNSTAGSLRLADHDVVALREEQALIRTRSRNYEGLSNRHDDYESITAQGTATIPAGRGSSNWSEIPRKKRPPPTPKFRHALPNPQTPEIRDESPNRGGREGRPRQRSSTTKYQVRKDEDALRARKMPAGRFLSPETMQFAQKQPIKKVDTPQARTQLQPEARSTTRTSPQLDQQSVREAYTESWLADSRFYTSSEHETPSEEDSENEVRYKWHTPNVQEDLPRRNRGSNSDGNNQYSTNSQRPSRRSLPDEAKPRQAFPLPISVPTFVVTTDGKAYWYRDCFPSSQRPQPRRDTSPSPQPQPQQRREGGISNTGLTDDAMLYLPSWGGVRIQIMKQTDSALAHHGLRCDSGSRISEASSESFLD